MQTRLLVCLAGCLAAAQIAAAASVSAEAYASAWIKQHDSPSGDELAELKSTNPTAYAIVKALLTKRSLGLLDPKHPSASFAAPPAKAGEDTRAVGQDAFAKFASPGELKVSTSASEASTDAAVQVAYPSVASSGSSHHDWLNWRPQQSAMDDDQMVKSVLGAVAELKGGGQSKTLLRKRSDSASPLAADEMEMDLTEDAAPAAQTAAIQPMVAATPPLRLNSVTEAVDQNPYSATLGFEGESAPAATAAAAPPQVKAAPVSALGNWLGVKSTVQRAAPTAPPQAQNPYLMALN